MSTAKHVVKKRPRKSETLTEAQRLLLGWLYESARRLDEASIQELTQATALLLVLRMFVEDLQVLQQASEGLFEE